MHIHKVSETGVLIFSYKLWLFDDWTIIYVAVAALL